MKARFCMRCGQELGEKVEAGRPRLCCGACGWVFYDNPLPVVSAIVELGDSVVLVRNHGWPEKMFGLPSGFLEKGESPEAGLRRELREELGIEVEVVSFVGAYGFEMRNELVLTWHVRALGEPVASDDVAECKRVPTAKLRPWPMGTGLALTDWLRARGRTDV